jgi:hypothetical protein
MRGPPPKDYHIGHPKVAKSAAQGVPSGPTRVAPFRKPPRIPKPSPRWLPETREWFESIEQSPISRLFQASDWSMSVAAAECLDVFCRTRVARLFSSFIALSNRLGMTIVDRQTARLDDDLRRNAGIPDYDDEEASRATSSWHARLAAVPDADDEDEGDA